MADTLSAGSGRPGIPRTIGDFTVAGVATRVVTTAPSDADWGEDSPPPNGTVVFQTPDTLWVRLGGTWRSTILF
jgi:hypothetical protein